MGANSVFKASVLSFSVSATYFFTLQINLQVNQWLTWLETAEEEESEEEAD